MSTSTDTLSTVRAAALFVSDVSVHDHPSRDEIEAAIRRSLRTRGGSRGCTADVAAAYGDHPELAAPRMRWARAAVESHYHRAPASRTCLRPTLAGPDRRPAPERDRLMSAA
jgi:hypothetical protein